jgi:hypothetical protein
MGLIKCISLIEERTFLSGLEGQILSGLDRAFLSGLNRHYAATNMFGAGISGASRNVPKLEIQKA